MLPGPCRRIRSSVWVTYIFCESAFPSGECCLHLVLWVPPWILKNAIEPPVGGKEHWTWPSNGLLCYNPIFSKEEFLWGVLKGCEPSFFIPVDCRVAYIWGEVTSTDSVGKLVVAMRWRIDQLGCWDESIVWTTSLIPHYRCVIWARCLALPLDGPGPQPHNLGPPNNYKYVVSSRCEFPDRPVNQMEWSHGNRRGF